eukprot:gene6587-7279_t
MCLIEESSKLLSDSGGEALFRQGWIFDSEQVTEWSKIALPPPNYADRDRDLLLLDCDALVSMAGGGSPEGGVSSSNTPTASQAATPFSSLSRTFQRMVFRNNSPSGGAAGASEGTSFVSRQSLKLDRQYIHASGLAVVRIAANGFLWMQNATARISDSPHNSFSFLSNTEPPLMTLAAEQQVGACNRSGNLSVDERRSLATAMMGSLETYCAVAVDCLELVLTTAVVYLSLDYSGLSKCKR